MDGIANWVLAYAGAHLLASLVIVPVAFLALRMRAKQPGEGKDHPGQPRREQQRSEHRRDRDAAIFLTLH